MTIDEIFEAVKARIHEFSKDQLEEMEFHIDSEIWDRQHRDDDGKDDDDDDDVGLNEYEPL